MLEILVSGDGGGFSFFFYVSISNPMGLKRKKNGVLTLEEAFSPPKIRHSILCSSSKGPLEVYEEVF